MSKCKHSKRFISCLLVMVMVVLTVSVSGSVSAITQSEKNKVDDINSQISNVNKQIKDSEKKLDEIEKEKKNTKSSLSGLVDETDELEKQIDAYDKKINLLNKSINELNGKIKITETQISLQQKDIDEARDALSERLRAMYMAGETSSIEILMSADSFESFLTRIQLVNSVSKHDKGLIDDLEKKVKKLEKDEKSLRDQKIKIQANKDDLNKSKNDLLPKKRLLDYKVGQINKEMYKLKQQGKVQTAIQSRLEKKKMQFEAEVDNLLRGHTSTGSGSGKLIWPVLHSRSYVSSPFGPRWGGVHRGMDITAPGAGHLSGPFTIKIIAAASGTVVYDGYNRGGYGNYLRIDHGDGLQTVYGHMYTYYVKKGAHVNQGQVIGIMGTTGNSTGAHLHFEVRVNNVKKNPKFYIGTHP